MMILKLQFSPIEINGLIIFFQKSNNNCNEFIIFSFNC